MEITMEQMTNSVLEVIFRADKYINAQEVTIQTGIADDEVIKAINRIKQYNELFLDAHESLFDEGLVNARVPEFFRDEVRKFLDKGGFVSLQQNTPLNINQKSEQQEFELQQLKSEISHFSDQDQKRKKTKYLVKSAGLIALLTLIIKKSHTFF